MKKSKFNLIFATIVLVSCLFSVSNSLIILIALPISTFLHWFIHILIVVSFIPIFFSAFNFIYNYDNAGAPKYLIRELLANVVVLMFFRLQYRDDGFKKGYFLCKRFYVWILFSPLILAFFVLFLGSVVEFTKEISIINYTDCVVVEKTKLTLKQYLYYLNQLV